MAFQSLTVASLSLLLTVSALAATTDSATSEKQATTVQIDATATPHTEQKTSVSITAINNTDTKSDKQDITATDNSPNTAKPQSETADSKSNSKVEKQSSIVSPKNAKKPNLEAMVRQAKEDKKKKEYAVTPITNHGKKWRIGYYHGGPYDSYQKSFAATVEGLMELGWIKPARLPPQENPKTVLPLWEWIVKNLSSDYIEFVEDAFYSFDWDNSKRVEVKQAVIERLNKVGDIDLMIVMGTAAGQDIANNEHSVPSIIGSTTDALASNIIKSVEDSGYDHIHAKIDPTRHEQQVWLFREIIGFQKLGIVYENTVEGRGFGGIDSVERVARREEFELVRCYAKNKNLDAALAERNLIRCFQRLAPKVDALYIARHKSANLQNLPARLGPLLEKRIPTFSQTGADEVKHGVLLSMALSSFRPLGLFYAGTIAKVFNGAEPRELPQLFKNPPKIAINLATAKAIDYDPPIEILGAADIIYQKIEPPPEPKK